MMSRRKVLVCRTTPGSSPACWRLFVVALALAAVPARAQSTIRVLVNDEPITSFDIQQRAKMLARLHARQAGREGGDRAADRRAPHAAGGEAPQRHVSDAEVDDGVRQPCARRQADGRAVQPGLARRRASTCRPSRISCAPTWRGREIVRARFRATVEVTEQDVAAALTRREAQLRQQQQTAIEYRLQQILFVVPERRRRRRRGEAAQRGECLPRRLSGLRPEPAAGRAARRASS